MLFFKVIIVTSCLFAILEEVRSYPMPGHHHKLIIYVPFKIKFLHHYKVKKVPVHIQKTIHHHYNDYDNHESHFDEGDSNVYEDESYHTEDDIEEQKNSKIFYKNYKKSQKWKPTESDDYEYE